ncbi:MAG TPA: hypothetical protein VLA42_07740 [Verrucomicrobiae bacterium]|jgi:hypothetical protein|nr:hypothetical protein [Verrucomicrobiae bacterium]
MATHSVLHRVNSPGFTNVVPIKSASVSQTITQLEIGLILELRRRAEQLQQQVDEAEQSVRARLEAGAGVEPGQQSASLKENLRRNVAWREVSERLADRLYGRDAGRGYCERVLHSTKPTRTVSLAIL